MLYAIPVRYAVLFRKYALAGLAVLFRKYALAGLAVLYTSSSRALFMMDPLSYSNADEVIVTHLEWDAEVDFERQVIQATATYTVKSLKPSVSRVCLDTSKLVIQSVVHHDGNPLRHTLHPVNNEKVNLGQKLEIQLPVPPHSPQQFSITYQVTNQSSAVLWRPFEIPEVGIQFPYLVTQCQAIHARSLVPCQDQPGVRFTYRANVTVPVRTTCVMSALPCIGGTSELIARNNEQKIIHFEQPVAISSNLLAMAVGPDFLWS